MIDIQLLTTPLLPDTCRAFVAGPDAGAIVEFIGFVRHQTKGKAVVRLEFEAYEIMALREMQAIAQQALEQFDILRVSMHHRTGVLGIGEVPVIIAVAAAHRATAFAACQFCIDRLKESVPIWKKEIFEDGEVWVAAHP